jgi:hypothetical protein
VDECKSMLTGLRFTLADIPPGSVVNSAHLVVQPDGFEAAGGAGFNALISAHRIGLGRAVHVEPMKSMLKAPRAKRCTEM